MKVDGKHIRSIWLKPDGWTVSAIDQRRLLVIIGVLAVGFIGAFFFGETEKLRFVPW